jgi:hypothetical protein
MKLTTRSSLAAVWLAASGALALSAPAQAHEQWDHGGHHGKEFTAQDHEAWAKKHLDKEASMLEIKASQEAAWDAYAAAKLDLMNSFGSMMKEGHHDDGDAATMARKHAEHATQIAQKLTALADATEKLQAALSEDQRKVLNRIAHHHHGFGEHGFHHHGFGGHEHQGKDMSKPAAKAPAAAAKAKQP